MSRTSPENVSTTVADAETGRPRALKARRIALVVVYSLFSLWLLLMATPLGVVVAGETPEGPFAYGTMPVVVFKWLTLGGYLVVAATAGRSVVAVQWIVAGVVAWAATEIVSPQESGASLVESLLPYVVNLLLVVGPWVLLAPERRELLHLRPRPDRPALAVAVVALVPLAVWASWAASVSGPRLPEELAEFRFDVVALPISFAVVGVLAALRPRATRWLLAVVAAAALASGVLALVLGTTAPGAPGRAAGAALVAVGAFLVWRARVAIS